VTTHVLGEAGRISLLLRRAGFAAGPTDLDHYLNLGWEATLQELLHPERVEWQKYCPRCNKHQLHKETK